MSDLQDAPFLTAARSLPEAIPRRPELPEAPFARQEMPPLMRQHFQSYAPRAADSFEDYLKAGFQQSVVGLAIRKAAPEVAIGPDTPWYGRVLSGAAGIAGDSPAMVVGFAGGAPVGASAGGTIGTAVPVIGNVAGAAGGAVVGGWAGAGALPAGLRATMMEMYTKGEVQSAS